VQEHARTAIRGRLDLSHRLHPGRPQRLDDGRKRLVDPKCDMVKAGPAAREEAGTFTTSAAPPEPRSWRSTQF
jgi:hypothetical protein